ncbi:hypothetical protein [Microbacterium sp. NPDC089696]|uniref:hypothetical protein n=1 Tax=Microbacterium sp. NPDC089696 TaxID=3364199 RepID=UPI0037FFF40F
MMVAVPDGDSGDWGWFRCWAPHRYTLSIEENDSSRDLCITVRESLVEPSSGWNTAANVGEFYDGDYAELVHGPREGRLLSLSERTSDSPTADDDAVALAMQVPLLQAMARMELLDDALVQSLRDAEVSGSSDEAIESLLSHFRRTVHDQYRTLSPDGAVRWWFASLAVSMAEGETAARASHLRDARRMLSAILNRDLIWVSGDWSEALCHTVRLAVLRLAEPSAH